MSSSRLPGKVLRDVAGKPMLVQQILRLRQCPAIDEIVIATTGNQADKPIRELGEQQDVDCFCGSEDDVLRRFVGAANKSKADVVIRVTADCPLVDPKVTDEVIHELVDHPSECDYASNVLERTYPRGLDVEVFYFDTLLRMDRLGRSRIAREHVTIVPRSERPELFLCRSVVDAQDNSDLRWTVDTEDDLRLISALFEQLDIDGRSVAYPEILRYARENPGLAEINKGSKTWTPE